MVIMAVLLISTLVNAQFDDMMMLDGGANPSLCTCACECARDKSASDMLREGGYNSELTSTAMPVKINNVA